MAVPYSESAELYDRVYATKDYRAEAEAVHRLIVEIHPDARTLLEVACGTGSHLLVRAMVRGRDIDASTDRTVIARGKILGALPGRTSGSAVRIVLDVRDEREPDVRYEMPAPRRSQPSVW